MAYEVRTAGPDDLLAVVRLVDHRSEMTVDQLSPEQQAAWARMLATSDLTVYVGHLGGEVVGTTSLLVMPHVTYGCRPTAFIEPLVVDAAHRRRGVARMMVERALADARALTCRKVQVLSHKRHAGDGALEFYRSVGFVAEAEGMRLYL